MAASAWRRPSKAHDPSHCPRLNPCRGESRTHVALMTCRLLFGRTGKCLFVMEAVEIHRALSRVLQSVLQANEVKVMVAQSCLTLWDPRTGAHPCPWHSPGKNTGVGCHSLLQGIFPTQGWNPGLPHCRQSLYHLSHKGSPCCRQEGNA